MRNPFLFYTPPLLTSTSGDSFNESSSLQTLLSTGFITSWPIKVNYSSFFAQCKAKTCTYSIYGRQSLPTIVTSTIGVFSGLSTVLKLLIPILVHVTYWFFNNARSMYRIKFWFFYLFEHLHSQSISTNVTFLLIVKICVLYTRIDKEWKL